MLDVSSLDTLHKHDVLVAKWIIIDEQTSSRTTHNTCATVDVDQCDGIHLVSQYK